MTSNFMGQWLRSGCLDEERGTAAQNQGAGKAGDKQIERLRKFQGKYADSTRRGRGDELRKEIGGTGTRHEEKHLEGGKRMEGYCSGGIWMTESRYCEIVQ